jgi:hypothetical protein
MRGGQSWGGAELPCAWRWPQLGLWPAWVCTLAPKGLRCAQARNAEHTRGPVVQMLLTGVIEASMLVSETGKAQCRQHQAFSITNRSSGLTNNMSLYTLHTQVKRVCAKGSGTLPAAASARACIDSTCSVCPLQGGQICIRPLTRCL